MRTINGHKVEAKVAQNNGQEYGYGIYVNGVVDYVIECSETLPLNASQGEIDKAIKHVEAKAERIAKNVLPPLA